MLSLRSSCAARLGGSKRAYLSDYEPLLSVVQYKNVTTQLMKGGLVTFSLGLLDYNKHIERNLRKEMEAADGEDAELDEYDWSAAREATVSRAIDFTCRFYFTSVIRRAMESVCALHLSVRWLDRLTKDVSKSLRRKLSRFHYLDACERILFTHWYGNITAYAASGVYDAIIEAVKSVHTKTYATERECVLWMLKKTIVQASNLALSSVGFAVGALVHPEYGALAGSLIFEFVGSLFVASLVQ